MSAEQPMKAAVSVAEMARMCSLSRARFYQLMKAGTFPPPEYDAQTGRPFYPEEKQRACLEVRRRNCYGVGERNVTPYGQVVQANTLPTLFERLAESSRYKQRLAEVRAFNAGSRAWLRGIALVPVKFGISFTRRTLNQANALVNIYLDGTVQVSTGGTETVTGGAGTDTQQIFNYTGAAQTFNINTVAPGEVGVFVDAGNGPGSIQPATTGNAQVIDSAGPLLPRDVSWTSWSRRNR